MSRVRDLLNVSPHFMRSVNLERDFSDPSALDGYVTTTEAISHLGQISNGLRKGSGQRAWKITGDLDRENRLRPPSCESDEPGHGCNSEIRP